MPDLIISINFNEFTPSMLGTISIGLMGGTYAGLCLCEKACRTSHLSGRKYISWLFFVCQPDMPLWLLSGLIMLTWENSIIRLQLVFWDYGIIPEPRPPDAPLACFCNRDVDNLLLEKQCSAQNGAKWRDENSILCVYLLTITRIG